MDKLLDVYEATLRGVFFSTFLSLGGFLFGAKTFILIKLKEGLYDGGAYKRTLKEAASAGAVVNPFLRLRQSHQFLAGAVGLCVLTSVLQFTVGLVHAEWAALVCTAAAALSVVVLVLAISVVNLNLHDWFGEVERRAREDASTEDALAEEDWRSKEAIADTHQMD